MHRRRDIDRCTTRILRVRTNGSRLQQLTSPELNASAPDYHPSGRFIAFDTHDNFPAPNAGHIAMMREDGSDVRVILRGDEQNFFNNPSFSPDGRQITFARWLVSVPNDPEIWTARADGRRAHALLADQSFANKPDWGSSTRRHDDGDW